MNHDDAHTERTLTTATPSTGSTNRTTGSTTPPTTTPPTTTTATAIPNPNIPTTTSTVTGPSHKSNLSSLLQQLDGSTKITTITKTALDWEHYKDQNCLNDALEQQTTATTAYLPKQEFLQRVDQRKYEQEKLQRLHEQGRAKK